MGVHESGNIKRPALRYYGGKWRIASWIISHFPDHFVYVEPFCGGASVLLQKDPSPSEVLNDLDGNVVNYFRVLRERPLELKRAIEFTPFSRQETYDSCLPVEDPLERARRFHVRAWQTMHGAPHMGRNGWRFGRRGGSDTRSPVDDWNDVDRLPSIAKRLKNVQIENDDALKIIPRFDKSKTLFFCDPPYLFSTRSDRWARNGYRHEMEDAVHEQLAETLRAIKGMAIVCGYPSPAYDRLYKGWKVVAIDTLARTLKAQVRRECLWVSPAAVENVGQLRLGTPIAGGGVDDVMFPLVTFDLVTNDCADTLLKAWGHWLGGCSRPFGRQSFGLSVEGEVLAVAVSASTVNATCGGIPRLECVELARLCSAPAHRDLTRAALRLWRKVAPIAWARKYWPVRALVSYSNSIRHKGDIYRFDGWTKVADVRGSAGGGSWTQKKTIEPKSVWVYELGRVG